MFLIFQYIKARESTEYEIILYAKHENISCSYY